jgi:hypothetical protein
MESVSIPTCNCPLAAPSRDDSHHPPQFHTYPFASFLPPPPPPSPSDRAFSDRAFSDRAFSDRAFSDRAFSDRAFSDRAFSDRAFSDGAFSDRAFSDRAFSDRAFSDRAFSDREPFCGGEQAASKRKCGTLALPTQSSSSSEIHRAQRRRCTAKSVAPPLPGKLT